MFSHVAVYVEKLHIPTFREAQRIPIPLESIIYNRKNNSLVPTFNRKL
jgi:hypothetical protein